MSNIPGSRLRQPGATSGLPVPSTSSVTMRKRTRAPQPPSGSTSTPAPVPTPKPNRNLYNETTAMFPVPDDFSDTFLLDDNLSLARDTRADQTARRLSLESMPTPKAPLRLIPTPGRERQPELLNTHLSSSSSSSSSSGEAASSIPSTSASTSAARGPGHSSDDVPALHNHSSTISSTSQANLGVPHPPLKRQKKRNSLAGPRSFAATHLNASGSSRVSPRTAIVRKRLPTTSTPALRKVSQPGATQLTSRAQPPRAPLGNATNRGRPAPATGRNFSQPRMPSGSLQATVGAARRLPSHHATASTMTAAAGSTGGFAGATHQSDELLTDRVDSLEHGMKTMADLLNEERQKAAQERSRLANQTQKEDNGRQVAESALAQQMSALLMQMQQMQTIVAQARKQGPRRSLEPEELEVLQIKHAKERRLLEEELAASQETIVKLRNAMTQNSTSHLTMESTNTALKLQLESQQAEIRAAQDTIASLHATIDELKASHTEMEGELRAAESLRRKLHNEVQELRGNIRVFARVRPRTNNDARNGSEAMANMLFPDDGVGGEKTRIEVVAQAESATGTMTMRNHLFTFDRVFQPKASQSEVFEEISHLTQSVLDGYNVAIFAYGQTGSGKTFTLEGASTESYADIGNLGDDAGMIPRAVQMLWQASEALKDKGWTYNFEGSILEIYCDGINDLLGKESFDKAHHEIKHDAKTGRTTVTDTVVVSLKSPEKVFELLEKAKKRRAVAATLMNERSSRSHSVFTLRVRGTNLTTRQSCDAVLNLVDLAGSERLSNSGSASDPVRLREAQSINKSLSSLADVIAALGAAAKAGGGAAAQTGALDRVGGVHIPYRNSTLTWLLKNSLGGNSKTLMMLALSPMAAHLNESLCSLRFATKVNSTHIGTAKKVSA
ncbi:kinesin-like nuclear fusion protein [Tilletia horrida]|nr:kinesin-like nuclear fusion protein [Tilletia horrida]